MMGSDRSRAWWVGAAVAGLAVTLFSVPAYAGDVPTKDAPAAGARPEPTAADRERARELMAQGRERRDANDLASALKSFQDADAIMRVPTTGFEVAKTRHMLGQWVEADETLSTLLKLPSSATDPAPFVEARTKALALHQELAAQIPAVRIKVTSKDPHVTVMVDGHAVSSVDVPYKLNPGAHAVLARAGGKEATATVQVASGGTQQVDLRLDDESTGTATVDARSARASTATDLPRISWIGFGVGAAGLALGSVTGIMALSQEADLADRCPDKRCTPASESDLDDARTMATVSTVGFVVAAVGAAVGVIGIVTRHPNAKTGDARVRTANDRASNTIRMELAGQGIRATF